jgi:hypothetical protein
MAKVSAPQEESSLPHLLAGLYKRGFTGRVEVTEARGKTAIFFRRGRVVKVQRSDGLERLHEVLGIARLASPAAIADAFRLHGDSDEDLAAALCRGGVITPDAMRGAVRQQMGRQLARSFSTERPRLEMSATEHRYRGAESPLGAELDPRLVIYAAIRATYDEIRLGRELASFLGARVKLLPVSPTFLQEAGFRSEDQAILRALTAGGIEVTESWMKASGAAQAKGLVLALHCLDLLDVERETVHDAPIPGPGEVPRRRTGVTGLNALDPATVGKMAEAFFKNGDTPRAERAFAIALGSDPQNKRLQAFASWIEFWKPSTDRIIALPDALKKMKDATKSEPEFAYGFFFLGSLQKMANDPEGAGRAFRAAIDLDAGFMEAQRELRLLTMRKGKGKTA